MALRKFNLLPFNAIMMSTISKTQLAKERKVPKEKKWMPKISREMILEIRTKHEYENYSITMLMNHFDMSRDAISRYVNYITQRDLIPKKPTIQ